MSSGSYRILGPDPPVHGLLFAYPPTIAIIDCLAAPLSRGISSLNLNHHVGADRATWHAGTLFAHCLVGTTCTVAHGVTRQYFGKTSNDLCRVQRAHAVTRKLCVSWLMGQTCRRRQVNVDQVSVSACAAVECSRSHGPRELRGLPRSNCFHFLRLSLGWPISKWSHTQMELLLALGPESAEQ